MKKMLCLALVVLAVLALFTGCSGRSYTNYGSYGRGNGNRSHNGMNDFGNVSTSRDGTVNGGENGSSMHRMNPNADMGAGK